jgi:hypothetical protein
MAAEPAGALEWAVQPFAAERTKGVSALLVVGATVYASFALGGPLLGFLAVLVLAGGVGPFFVKTRYRLSADGVEVRSPFQRVRRPWSAFRRVYVGPKGVSLSPFAGRHFLEPYRSVMLRYGDRRDDILRWVREYGPAIVKDSR